MSFLSWAESPHPRPAACNYRSLLTGCAETNASERYLGINLTSLTTSSAIKETINNSQMCCLEPHRINTVIWPSSALISLSFLQPSKFTFPKGILWPAPRHLTPDQEIQTRNISSSATLKPFKRYIYLFFCLADKIYFGPCCFSPITLL